MAEAGEMLSPLYSDGVGHAAVNTPTKPDTYPDPLKLMPGSSKSTAGMSKSSSGPDSDWSARSPKN